MALRAETTRTECSTVHSYQIHHVSVCACSLRLRYKLPFNCASTLSISLHEKVALPQQATRTSPPSAHPRRQDKRCAYMDRASGVRVCARARVFVCTCECVCV
eukprot:334356-Pleurochrysis_carterae.AAC.1